MGRGAGSASIPDGLLPELVSDRAGEWGTAESGQVQGVTPEQERAAARGRQVALWLQQQERLTAPSFLDNLVVLHQLERLTAPFSLDGYVVAAMNPGFRQSRAVQNLSHVSAIKAPQLLDQLVAKRVLDAEPSTIEYAPSALDQLVEKLVQEVPSEVSAPRESHAHEQRGQREAGSRWLRTVAAGLALAAGVLLIARLEPPRVDGQLSLSEIATARQAVDGEVLRTASGLTFKVTYVDESTQTEADSSVIRAMGLPAFGGI